MSTFDESLRDIQEILSMALPLEAERPFRLSWIIDEPLLCHFVAGEGWSICAKPEHCDQLDSTRFLATGEYENAPGYRLVLNLPLRVYRNLQSASPYPSVAYWLLTDGSVLIQRQGEGLNIDYRVLKEIA